MEEPRLTVHNSSILTKECMVLLVLCKVNDFWGCVRPSKVQKVKITCLYLNILSQIILCYLRFSPCVSEYVYPEYCLYLIWTNVRAALEMTKHARSLSWAFAFLSATTRLWPTKRNMKWNLKYRMLSNFCIYVAACMGVRWLSRLVIGRVLRFID